MDSEVILSRGGSRCTISASRGAAVLCVQQRVPAIDRPVDADLGIVPDDRDLVGPVEVGALVLDVRGLGEHAEAVGEARRDLELAEVLSGEHLAHPFAEGGGVRPDVDRHVEDLADDGPHQLPLGEVELGVQAAQRPRLEQE